MIPTHCYEDQIMNTDANKSNKRGAIDKRNNYDCDKKTEK